MAQETLNLGTVANDGTGDDLRSGGTKINNNFTELYTDKANTSDLAAVATSGDYNDLDNKPTLGTAASADTTDFDAAGTAVGVVLSFANSLGSAANADTSDFDAAGTAASLISAIDLTNLPSTDEKAALAGTDGSASGTNKYVTDSDPRNADSRSPTSHGSTHTNGTDDIQDATASQKGLATAAQIAKLDGIEASADVTNATNVAAAGAVMESDTSTVSMSFVVDEDDMTSNSATKVPTQQSVKAYVDANSGNAAAILVTESTTSRTLGLTDANKYIRLTNGSPCDITLPNQATVTWLADTEIYFRVAAAGIPTFTLGGSVVLNDPKGVVAALVQGDTFAIKRVASDVWDLI